jgi:hypothetical protein
MCASRRGCMGSDRLDWSLLNDDSMISSHLDSCEDTG